MAIESGAPFAVSGFLRHHVESGFLVLRGAPYWVFAVPFAIIAVVALLLQTPLAVIASKPVQEFVGIYLAALTAILAFILHYKRRVFFTLLLSCLTACLFLREWHFWGTTEGVLVALAALAWWASSRRDDILPVLQNSLAGPLLLAAFWTYAVSQFLDQHYLLSLDLVAVRDYLNWHNHLEETLETSGHLMILTAVLLTWRNLASKDRAASSL